MMRLFSFRVEGFRSLANIEIPPCDYTILIGRNNSGKSAVLLALKLLFEGTTRDLAEDDFYAQEEQRADQVVLEAILDGVSEYLPLCNEKHRTKIANCVVDGRLRIRRMGSRSPLEFGKLELWQPDKGDFGLPTGIESALKQLLPEVILNQEPCAKSAGYERHKSRSLPGEQSLPVLNGKDVMIVEVMRTETSSSSSILPHRDRMPLS